MVLLALPASRPQPFAMTKREAKKLMRTQCAGRLCVSFLQDDQGRAIFRRSSRSFFYAVTALTWFMSSLFVFLASGCATAPREKATETTATVAESQNDQTTTQKAEKPRRRWTGF
jgi:hypothetical protein